MIDSRPPWYTGAVLAFSAVAQVPDRLREHLSHDLQVARFGVRGAELSMVALMCVSCGEAICQVSREDILQS
jgi:hypothetical protein